MSMSKSDSDVVLNRANVALARSQRLVTSWLPALSAEERTSSAAAKSEEDLQREEDEIFTPVPETLGVGAPLPEKAADGSWNRSQLDSNDTLRRQLLGRNYQKVMKAAATNKKIAVAGRPEYGAEKSSTASGQTSARHQQEGGDDEEEEEEGRAALVGKKRRKADSGPNQVPSGALPADDGGNRAGSETETVSSGLMASPSRPAKSKKKTTSYLDEILADRAKKRKKR